MTRKRFVLLSALVGTMLSMTLSPTARAQSVDALLDKLVDKGILSVQEAGDLRKESDKNFMTVLRSRNGMPDWVTSLKFAGDFRGRAEEFKSDNSLSVDRTRLRYRVRFGVTAAIQDNFEVGFRLGSGDSSGNPISNNTSMENNGTKKPIWVDLAYAKWTPIHNGDWTASATFGKMNNPFQLSSMVFDPDYTPEGLGLQAAYKINDAHSVRFNSAGFVLDEVPTSGRDPFIYGAQVIWESKWSPKLESALSVSALNIVNKESLANSTAPNPPFPNPGGVPDNNAGNTRGLGAGNFGALLNNYNPIVGGASLTYTLDSFPFYKGKFPIKPAGEYMFNPGASDNNRGYWAGITFGKAGKRGTWDLSYRYQRLEADAWYEELVDDDNAAFYSVASSAYNPKAGFLGGTNVKGHLIKLNYALTDSLTVSFSGYFNDLIINPNPGLAHSGMAAHFYGDLMWKF